MAAKKKKTGKVIREFVSPREKAAFETFSSLIRGRASSESIELAHFSSRATRTTVHRLTEEDNRRGVVRKESYHSHPYITVDLVITRHEGGVMTSVYDKDGHSVDMIRVKSAPRTKLTGKRLKSLY